MISIKHPQYGVNAVIDDQAMRLVAAGGRRGPDGVVRISDGEIKTFAAQIKNEDERNAFLAFARFAQGRDGQIGTSSGRVLTEKDIFGDGSGRTGAAARMKASIAARDPNGNGLSNAEVSKGFEDTWTLRTVVETAAARKAAASARSSGNPA